MIDKKGFLSMIKDRQTTRLFGKKPVYGHSIRIILEAGRWAPSPLNNQPWHFVVLEKPEIIGKMMKTAFYGDPHNSPPLIVAIVIDGKYMKPNFKQGAVPGSLGVIECYMSAAMAALNMSYAAQALGIDSCMITPYPLKAESILHLKTGDFVPIFLCFGHGMDEKGRPPRERKGLRYIVSYGAYGESRIPER